MDMNCRFYFVYILPDMPGHIEFVIPSSRRAAEPSVQGKGKEKKRG